LGGKLKFLKRMFRSLLHRGGRLTLENVFTRYSCGDDWHYTLSSGFALAIATTCATTRFSASSTTKND